MVLSLGQSGGTGGAAQAWGTPAAGKTLTVGCGPRPGTYLAGRGLEKGGILASI